jgi:hypothetical protein
VGTSTRLPPLPRRPPPSTGTERRPIASPPLPPVPDTLLPGARPRSDTLMPVVPAVANSRTAASIAAIRATVDRLKRRLHR